jgi:hypothetical protein
MRFWRRRESVLEHAFDRWETSSTGLIQFRRCLRCGYMQTDTGWLLRRDPPCYTPIGDERTGVGPSGGNAR